jgi:glycosyltransferase involved in cell wall biosynthesis
MSLAVAGDMEVFMKKKVMFLINTLSCGGAEKVLVNIANNLNHEKFDVTVITILFGGEFSTSLSDDVHYKHIIPFKNKYLKRIMYKIFLTCYSAKVLYKLFAKEKYNIEVAFLEGLPTKVVSSSNNKESFKIAWIHTDLEMNNRSDYCFKNLKEQIASYSKFDQIICVSNVVSKVFINRFGFADKVKVYINPVDEKKIILLGNEKNESLKTSNNTFYFVAVGRLANEKGFDRLIKVIARLHSVGVGCKASIVGEGVERPFLEQLIKEYKLENQVSLLGYKENPYMYIKIADALVLSSRVEGYVSVIAEALILGVPVVAVNCAGVDEILDHGKYGICVENTEENLYKAMKKLVQDKSLLDYYKNQARIRGQEYCLNNSMKRLEELFNGK